MFNINNNSKMITLAVITLLLSANANANVLQASEFRPICDGCDAFFGFVKSGLTNPTLRQAIFTQLRDVCTVVPDSKQCMDAFNQMEKIVIDFGESFDGHALCVDLQMCDANAYVKYGTKSDTSCSVCTGLVRTLVFILMNPQAEEKAKHALDLACTNTGAMQRMCTEIVNWAMDYAVSYITEHENTICKAVHFCA